MNEQAISVISDDGRIEALCAKSLERNAKYILNVIANEVKSLADGETVQVSGIIFRLIQSRGKFLVVDDDSISSRDTGMDITDAVTMIVAQTEVLRVLGVREALTCSLKQNVIFQKGCLTHTNVYAEREEGKDNTDSGWYIGSIDQELQEGERSNPDSYEVTSIKKILSFLPTFSAFITLPVGYMVTFCEKEIVQVYDYEGNGKLQSYDNTKLD